MRINIACAIVCFFCALICGAFGVMCRLDGAADLAAMDAVFVLLNLLGAGANLWIARLRMKGGF